MVLTNNSASIAVFRHFHKIVRIPTGGAWEPEKNRRFKPVKHSIIRLLILSIVIPVSAWAAEKAGPKMVIAEPVFDAGKVDQGTALKHDFIIKNTGDEELRITKVKPD